MLVLYDHMFLNTWPYFSPWPTLMGRVSVLLESLSLLFQLISDFRFIDTSTFLGLDMVCTIT